MKPRIITTYEGKVTDRWNWGYVLLRNSKELDLLYSMYLQIGQQELFYSAVDFNFTDSNKIKTC